MPDRKLNVSLTRWVKCYPFSLTDMTPASERQACGRSSLSAHAIASLVVCVSLLMFVVTRVTFHWQESDGEVNQTCLMLKKRIKMKMQPSTCASDHSVTTGVPQGSVHQTLSLPQTA